MRYAFKGYKPTSCSTKNSISELWACIQASVAKWRTTNISIRSKRVGILLFIALSAYSTNANSKLKFLSFSPSQISLNRTAVPLTASQLGRFAGSHGGFQWNKGDNKTAKWRPQGIAGFVSGGRNFMAVSWYGRKSENYENRGVRVSFVDLSNRAAIKYRHVLLVDELFRSFVDMHAGGLVIRNNRLHVPDSRSNANRIHVFDLNKILEVPKLVEKKFFGYRYVLRKTASYSVPVKPSFMSYDWDANQMLVGTFHRCGKTHSDTETCRSQKNNKLVWFPLSQTNRAFSSVCGPFFSEMQGAATGRIAGIGQPILWAASSYGRSGISHLHISTVNRGSCSREGARLGKVRTITYPPGLEDLHISKSSGDIWMLTEFGPHEGSGNDRVVFVTHKNKLKPF